MLGLLEAAPVAEGARVVDVGSGTGVPGVPLAVVRPDLQVLLCESDRRRAGFLTHVAGLLGLRGVRVAALRAEELGRRPDAREAFDAAVSRWGTIFEPDAEAAAARIRGFLKPGARIAISSAQGRS